MDGDGANARRLTNNQSYEGYPVWSPDGKRIVFVSDRDEPDPVGCGNSATGCNSNIYVINIDNLNETRLADSPSDDEGPSWSPDGTQIAFFSNRPGNMDIYVMDADGSNVTRLTINPADDWRPRWSPDGKHIAFASYRDGNGEIYVMDADGSNVTRWTNNQQDDSAPAWSPDGQHIAFHSSSSDGNAKICIIDFNGSNMTCLTNNLTNAWEPVWQPFTTLTNNLTIMATEPTSNTSTPAVTLPTSILDQTGGLTGRLISKTSSMPVVGAGVVLCRVEGSSCTTDAGLTTTTGVNGEFEFQEIPVGNYVILYNPSGIPPQSMDNIIVEVNDKSAGCLGGNLRSYH